MKISSLKFRCFLVGWMSYAAVQSLYQDFLGKFGYINHVEKTWVHWSISTPFALVVLILCYISYKQERISS